MGAGTRMQEAADSSYLAAASDVQPGQRVIGQTKTFVFIPFANRSAGKTMSSSSPAEYLAHQIGGAIFKNTGASWAKSHQSAYERSNLPAPNDAGSRKAEEIVGMAKRYSGVNQLLCVQTQWNRTIRYASDMTAWGKADYQADARESAARGRGDCDDYAFAKAWTLKEAGVPADRIFTLTFKSGYGLDGRRHEAHTVCAVVDESNKIYVLDNRYQGLRTLDQTLRSCGPCAGICSMEEQAAKPAVAAVSSEAPGYLAGAAVRTAQARAQQEQQGMRLGMGA